MKLTTSIFIGLVSSISIFVGVVNSQTSPLKQVQTILPSEIEWRNNLDLNGIETANVIGDPSQPELYVLFGKMPPKAILSAHTHPDDRVTTVVSGVIYYGTGNKFDPSLVEPYPTGSVIYTPANTPHFMWAKEEEVVLQHTGVGPTEIDFITTNN